MKTFKRFLLLLAATVLTSTVRAQVINCDLNYNGVLDIEDVTMLIDGYLTGDTSLVNTDPFTVENNRIVGTWYKSPTESITFREDGTTNYMAGCTYKYMPWQGYIQFYNSDGFPVHAVRVTEVTSDYLAILPTGSDDPILYTAVSISLSQTTLELKPNEIVRLTAKVLPSSASPVVWSSSNNRVATVENGFVTGIADGTATITAEVARAKATCTVKVVSKVPVTKITLSSTSLSLTVGGGNGNLAAVVSPSNATDKSLTWVSSQPSVATVSNDGIVTPVSGGTTTITAMANDGSGVKASCTVTVTVPVSSITLSSNTLSLFVGKTSQLTASVSPSTATNKSVTWSTSNSSIATVSAEGVVKAVGEGKAAITATAKDGSGIKASCTVTVTVPVSTISLSSNSLALFVGKSSQLTATVSPTTATNQSLTWSTSNTNIATVSADGIVKAVGEGKAIITATAKDGSGIKATCDVTVTVPVSTITLSATTLSLFVNKTSQLTATVSPSTATDKSVTWSTSNSNVATVSTDGTVKAISKGTATITATAKDGSGIKATCEVTVTVPVSTITLSASSLSLFVNKTSRLTATVSPTTATDKSVTWSSSNSSVATVSADGVVKAVGEGKATITATAKDGSGVKATCEVTVTVPVSSITLSSNSLSLDVGKTSQLTATVSPTTATDKSVTWSSSNSNIATVSADGVVKAISQGTVTITAMANDGSGVKASCEVTVVSRTYNNGYEYVDLGLSVKWATMNVGASSPEEYGEYFAWGETTPKDTYKWSTYKWCKGSYNTMTKYCTNSSYGTVDNKSVLDPEDDAAHVNWGGTWRMPTHAEQDELMSKCTWTWMTQNGVKGRLVTGPNGNSIFLPAAGYRGGSLLSNAGSYGHYWSSSLDTDNPFRGWYLYFRPSNFDVSYSGRYYGLSVRAVCP